MALSFLRFLSPQSPVTLFPVLQPHTSHHASSLELQIGRETSLLGSLIPKCSPFCLLSRLQCGSHMWHGDCCTHDWYLGSRDAWMTWNLVWLPSAVLLLVKLLKSRYWRGLPELSGSYLRGHLLAVFFPASPLLVPTQEQFFTLGIAMDPLTHLYLVGCDVIDTWVASHGATHLCWKYTL